MYLSKLDNFSRLIYLNTYFKKNNSVLITEYPKSGATWLGKMIAEYMYLDFPQRSYVKWKPTLFHGHYLPEYGIQNFSNIIVMKRDPRDVLVSYYFHLNFLHKSGKNEKEFKETRRKFNGHHVENVMDRMPEFIDYIYNDRPKKWEHFFHPSTWDHFYDAWAMHEKIIESSYEALLANTAEELTRIISELGHSEIDEQKIAEIVEKNSFEKLTARKKGEENRNSFLRKGISGDWKNYFNEESKDLFKKYYGEALITHQYEKNQDW